MFKLHRKVISDLVLLVDYLMGMLKSRDKTSQDWIDNVRPCSKGGHRET